MYDIKAKPAAKPGILYTNNKNKIIIIKPTIPAWILFDKASLPKLALWTLWLNSSSCTSKEPIPMFVASVWASFNVKSPVICACPPVMAAWIFGALKTSSS